MRPTTVNHSGSRVSRDDSGFTMIEVIVAAALFVIGSLATLALLDTGASATSKSLQADRANAVGSEIIERASGLRNTLQHNDLVDERGAVNPGVRIAAAMAPDASSPPAVTVTGTPGRRVATWTLTRGSSTYDVSYASCTRSDRVGLVRIQGPYDCDLPPKVTDPDPDPAAPCEIQLVNKSELESQFAAHAAESDITVKLQLLNTLGAQLCLEGTLNSLGVGKLLAPACGALGSGANALNTVNGLLGSVFGSVSGLGAKVALSVCPRSNGTPYDPQNPAIGIGTTTNVEVTVSWYPTGAAQTAANRRTIVQSSVIRRPGA